MFENFKKKAKVLKKQTTILYLAYLHKGIVWYKKLFVLLILIYALSPIDLIPDFIPILGLLDDLIIISLGVWIAVKMIPKNIWQECLEQAETGVAINKKYKIAGVVFICSIWALVIYMVIMIFFN